MGKLRFGLLLAVPYLVSCVTPTTFTREGRAVRTISPVVAQTCKHLGITSSWKPSGVGGLSAAQIDIRNKVAALGGNSMLVVSQRVDPPPHQHAELMAEVYRCDFNSSTQ